jgi:hypothetical protein
MIKKTKFLFLSLFLTLLLTTGCQANWQIALTDLSGLVKTINRGAVEAQIKNAIEPVESVPLGQLFYKSGFTLIYKISLKVGADQTLTFHWDNIAEGTTINESGTINIFGEEFNPTEILISPSPHLQDITFSIMDISPTVAAGLGLPEIVDAQGQNRLNNQTHCDQAVMILMDGVQYEVFSEMVDAGLLPFFKDHGDFHQGLTVYPPITTSATAALLTSTTPDKNGVYGYGYRNTESTTLFDLATENGLSVVAIEGASLPFNLRNADTSLSGDQDGNGYSDDNVYMNSLKVIQTEMPDLLYIHFHEIDDMGHSYGPESKEYQDALVRVDTYISEIYKALPDDTFIVIFADHGMHTTPEGGNHGCLVASDLIIPILFIEK